MINPTKKDIGRKVIYQPYHWKDAPKEYGVIKSFNSYYVFVVYGKEIQTKAIVREDLKYA